MVVSALPDSEVTTSYGRFGSFQPPGWLVCARLCRPSTADQVQDHILTSLGISRISILTFYYKII